MPLFRFLARLLILTAGAVLGLALFLIAVVVFIAVLFASLIRGKKPSMQFRMNKNPWAQRRAPASEDVVDIEVREVPDTPPGPPGPPAPPAALTRPEQSTPR